MATALHPALSRPVGVTLLHPSQRVTREELDRADRLWRTLHHRGNLSAVYLPPYPRCLVLPPPPDAARPLRTDDWGSETATLVGSVRSESPTLRPTARNGFAYVYPAQRAQMQAEQQLEQALDRMMDQAAGLDSDSAMLNRSWSSGVTRPTSAASSTPSSSALRHARRSSEPAARTRRWKQALKRLWN